MNVVDIALLTALVGALLGAALMEASERRRRHLAGRPALSAEEFGSYYFSGGAARVAPMIRAVISPYLDIDVRYLHPDDQFVRDLRLGALDGDAPEDLLWHVEKACGVAVAAEAAQRMRTLRDLIEHVAEASRRRHSV